MDHLVSRISPAEPPPSSARRRFLRQGGLVAFPTETVYGLGADATSGKAVAGIFAAKGRPRFNPLIVHVGSLEEAERHAHFPLMARQLAEAFWPGALTLVLPRRADSPLSELVSAGPGHGGLARSRASRSRRALLQEAGLPIAAPSANPSGRVSATTAAACRGRFGRRWISFSMADRPRWAWNPP